MTGTSQMSGTLRSVDVPSASRQAAITLSTLFFAPLTRTSPASRAPPETRKRSIVNSSYARATLSPEVASRGMTDNGWGGERDTGGAGRVPRVRRGTLGRAAAHRVPRIRQPQRRRGPAPDGVGQGLPGVAPHPRD